MPDQEFATKKDLIEVKDELKQDISELRQATKEDLKELKNELRNEFRQDMKEFRDDIIHQFGIIAESLESKIELVAEQYLSVNNKINREIADNLRKNMSG